MCQLIHIDDVMEALLDDWEARTESDALSRSDSLFSSLPANNADFSREVFDPLTAAGREKTGKASLSYQR